MKEESIGRIMLKELKGALPQFTSSEVNELFRVLFIQRGDELKCASCGEKLGSAVGEKCKLVVELDNYPTNPHREFPVLWIECPKCQAERDITREEWTRLGEDNKWFDR